jgi:hypothetical protein
MDYLKVMGKARPMILRNKPLKLGVKFDTTFYSNSADNPFIKKLAKLGFQVVSFNQKYIRVMLPLGWTHLRISKDAEVILDDKQRDRIVINNVKKTSTLLRRFDFIINMISVDEGTEKKHILIAEITDCGEVVEQYPVDSELMSNFKEGGDDLILESFKQATAQMIEAQYPDSQNELAYWEE